MEMSYFYIKLEVNTSVANNYFLYVNRSLYSCSHSVVSTFVLEVAGFMRLSFQVV